MSEEGAPDEPVLTTKHADPFEGDSRMLTWSEEVNIGQLVDELSAALPEVQSAVCPPQVDGVDVDVDATNPLVIFVSPSSTDLSQVRQVLAAHRPDRYYGLSEQEVQEAQLVEKINSDQQLTPAEMQMALKMLISS